MATAILMAISRTAEWGDNEKGCLETGVRVEEGRNGCCGHSWQDYLLSLDWRPSCRHAHLNVIRIEPLPASSSTSPCFLPSSIVVRVEYREQNAFAFIIRRLLHSPSSPLLYCFVIIHRFSPSFFRAVTTKARKAGVGLSLRCKTQRRET